MIRALGAAGLVLLLAGCQGRGPAGRTSPVPPSTGASFERSAGAASSRRVAVVDLLRAAAAHPRWPDLATLDRRIAGIQAELALTQTAPAQSPQIDLSAQMKAEAERAVEQMRPEFRRAFEEDTAALHDAARRELEAYADKIRADQQAEFETRRKALEAQITKAVAYKQQEMTSDNAQFQQQMLAQYRIPLLNLRLKQETVQQTDRQEADRLSAQIQALTQERDDKVAAHEKANQQVFQEFQQRQSQQYTAGITDIQQQLTSDGRRLIDAKTAEINARLRQQIAAKEAELNTVLNTRLRDQLRAREQVLVAGARDQVTRSQQQAAEAARAHARALDAQLQAAQEERSRLLAAIMADLRVEAAALAQAKGWDLILTQAVATFDAVDATDDLIARIKR